VDSSRGGVHPSIEPGAEEGIVIVTGKKSGGWEIEGRKQDFQFHFMETGKGNG